MKDIKQEFLDKGLGYIKGELAGLVSKGKNDSGQGRSSVPHCDRNPGLE